MKIIYNDIEYYFNNRQSLRELLERKELIELPLKVWKDLLEIKEGIVYNDRLKKVLLSKLEYYDKSEDINSFYFNGRECWIDKYTRSSLVNLTNSTDSSIQLYLDPEFIEISSSDLKNFLQQLEVYASKCYVTTQQHKLVINQLTSVEDLINYDYTQGYPEKITLNG